ncbi:MAG: YggS family pyridoxal phosphate-dependent enzyme [Pseudomonadota bacterium]
MIRVTESLGQVRKTLQNEAAATGRDAAAIRLVAVSKRHPEAAIRAAWAAGQRDFGENFVDEGVAKITALGDCPSTWHYIGAMQSNKTRQIAQHFDWVHTVERAKIATRLNDQRPPERGPLEVCIQVNIDQEPQKAGITPAALHELANMVAKAPNLRLRGLMCLPRPRGPDENAREPFARLRALLETLRLDHPELDTLSMGMSGDLGAAIAEGATIVRVGTAIFGPRPAR